MSVLGVLGRGAVEAHAAALAGETFTSQAVSGSTLTGACTDINSNAGTFNFSVSGTAAGPFPAPLRNPEVSPRSPTAVSEFSSTFTITSTLGTVTGSKRLAGALSKASCTFLPERTQVVSTSNVASIYTATVNGAQQSSGRATFGLEGVVGAAGPTFFENFASSGAVQPPG